MLLMPRRKTPGHFVCGRYGIISKIRNTCRFFLARRYFDLLYAYAFFLHYLTVSLMVFLAPFTAIT
jgi:hypothetical protein